MVSLIRNLFNPYRGMPKEIYIIFIARIIQATGSFVMPMLTLILTDKIGLSELTAGTYITMAGIIYMPAAMIGGKLADSFGRKKVIMFFDTLGAVFYIIAGLIEPSMITVYFIMLAGACMTISGPAHDSLIADLTTPENRDGAYALSYMGWNLGFAVGPIIGGFLYKHHFSLIFIGDAIMALIARFLIGIFINETLHKTKEEIKDQKRSKEKQETGSIFKVLLRRLILIYFALITFAYNLVYSQWSFMLPLQINGIYHDNGAQLFGILASMNGLIVITFTPIMTRIMQKVVGIRRMVYGGMFYAVGFGMLGFVHQLPFFFISCFIFTLGEIVLAISTVPFIMNHTPASHRGRMSAIVPMISNAGYTLGPMVMGSALTLISIEAGWRYLGILALIASGFMFALEKYSLSREKNEEIHSVK